MARQELLYERMVTDGSIGQDDLYVGPDGDRSVVRKLIELANSGITFISSVDREGSAVAEGTGYVTLGLNWTEVNSTVQPLWENIQNRPDFEPGTIYTFTNGLTENSGTVRLGGTINQQTSFNLNNYKVDWIGTNSTVRFTPWGGIALGVSTDSSYDNVSANQFQLYASGAARFGNTNTYWIDINPGGGNISIQGTDTSKIIVQGNVQSELVLDTDVEIGPSYTVSTDGYQVMHSTYQNIPVIFKTGGGSRIKIDNNGLLVNALAGTGNRMVVANASGQLTVQSLPVLTESDPVFVASPAYAITNADRTNWTSAYNWGNHASAGYLKTLPVHTHPISEIIDLSSQLAGKANVNHTHTWSQITDAPNMSDYVTVATDQTVSGKKTFSNPFTIMNTAVANLFAFDQIGTTTGPNGTTGIHSFAAGYIEFLNHGETTMILNENGYVGLAKYGMGNMMGVNESAAFYLAVTPGGTIIEVAGPTGGITTETDPTVPSHVKSITSAQISNWNAAYGWGNHASAGYAKPANTGNAGWVLTWTGSNAQWMSAPLDGNTYPTSLTFNGGTFTINLNDRPALTVSLDGRYAMASHTHAISDIVDLQSQLNGKAATSHTHTIAGITDFGVSLPSTGQLLRYNASTSKWENWTPNYLTSLPAHTHAISDIVDLQSQLNGKASTSHTHDWTAISGKPTSFTPTSHSHAISDIVDLVSTLNGKASVSHTHTWSQITDAPNLSNFVTIGDTQTVTGSKTFSANFTSFNNVKANMFAFDTIGTTTGPNGTTGMYSFAPGYIEFLNHGETTLILNENSYISFGKYGMGNMMGVNESAAYYLAVTPGGTVIEVAAPTGSGSETDPTVPQHVKNITTTQISNWNQVYSWGNHANAGYMTSVPLLPASWISSGVFDPARLANGTASDGYVIKMVSGAPTWSAVSGGGGLSGSGTNGWLAKWNSDGTLGGSYVYSSTGGQVGIGTSSPVSLSRMTVQAFSDNSSQYAQYWLNWSGTGIGFLDGAGNFAVKGDITGFYSFSDARLKHDVKPLNQKEVAEKLMQMNPVSFKWNDNEEAGEQVGFIAQEVEQIFPEIVREAHRFNGQTYKTVDYEKGFALAVAAIKELTERIKILENK